MNTEHPPAVQAVLDELVKIRKLLEKNQQTAHPDSKREKSAPVSRAIR